MFPVVSRFVARQKWLDALGTPLQNGLVQWYRSGPYSRQQLQNLLNGVWLGHPLHPVITDVPVGAWTATAVLDILSTTNPQLESAADITLATGLAAGLAAGVTGATDWMDTYGTERSVGLLHGLSMVTSVLLYAGALAARLNGARRAGVVLANTGYLVMAAGAYLGGDEVYDLGYPVNHTAFQHGPGEYVPVMPEADLPANQLVRSTAKDVPILLVKQGNHIYCLDDTCVHAGCSLAGGHLDGASVVCPCHGSRYHLQTGAVINGPATMPEPAYDVRVRNGTIEVKQAIQAGA